MKSFHSHFQVDDYTKSDGSLDTDVALFAGSWALEGCSPEEAVEDDGTSVSPIFF